MVGVDPQRVIGLTKFRRDPLGNCNTLGGEDELTLTHNGEAVGVVVSPERFARLEDRRPLDVPELQALWLEKLRRKRHFKRESEAIVVALLQVRSVLELLTDEWVREIGIDDLQLDILFILVDQVGPCTPEQILRRLVCSSKRLTYALKKLEEDKRVLKVDARYVATDAGRELEGEFWRRFVDDCERLLARLDGETTRSLLHGLYTVSQRIERFTESLKEERE